MSKYIDAIWAAEIISEKYGIPLADLVDVFADIPATDVTKNVSGYWKIRGGAIVCSVCDEPYFFYQTYLLTKYKYCPICGAKMEN